MSPSSPHAILRQPACSARGEHPQCAPSLIHDSPALLRRQQLQQLPPRCFCTIGLEKHETSIRSLAQRRRTSAIPSRCHAHIHNCCERLQTRQLKREPVTGHICLANGPQFQRCCCGCQSPSQQQAILDFIVQLICRAIRSRSRGQPLKSSHFCQQPKACFLARQLILGCARIQQR